MSCPVRITATWVLLAIAVHLPASLLGQEWEWLNPRPHGHSLSRLQQIDATTFFYVGEAGRMYKYRDGVTTEITTPSVLNLLGLHFFDENTGYVVGEYGLLLKTTDCGDTWEIRSSGTDADLGSIYFPNPDRGFIAGRDGAVYRSVDGGDTWSSSPSGLPSLIGLFFWSGEVGIAFDEHEVARTTNGGVSFSSPVLSTTGLADFTAVTDSFGNPFGVLAGDSGRTYVTPDSGAQWVPNSSNGFFDPIEAAAYGPNAHLYSADGRPGMRESTDNGASWTDLGLLGEPFSDLAMGDGIGLGLPPFGMPYRSTDGGRTWGLQGVGKTTLINAIHAFGDVATYGEVNGSIYRSTDGGFTWIMVHETPGGTISDITYGDGNTGIAVGGTETGSSLILRTSDGGLTWDNVVHSGTTLLTAAIMIEPQVGYAVGLLGQILKTINGGLGWFPLFSGTSQDLFGVDFVSPDTGYAVGAGGTVLRTVDGGVSWTPLPAGVGESLLGADFADVRRGLVVGNRGVALRTTDGGQNWTQVLAEAFHQERDFTGGVFVAGSNGRTPGVTGEVAVVIGLDGMAFFSEDGGDSWDTLPVATRNDLWDVHMPHPDSAIYVSGEGGTIKRGRRPLVGIAGRANDGLAEGFRLLPNYPNPFNPATRIPFELARSGSVDLSIYSIDGKRLVTLAAGRYDIGPHEVRWDGRADGGVAVASGIYLAVLETGGVRAVRKLVLLR